MMLFDSQPDGVTWAESLDMIRVALESIADRMPAREGRGYLDKNCHRCGAPAIGLRSLRNGKDRHWCSRKCLLAESTPEPETREARPGEFDAYCRENDPATPEPEGGEPETSGGWYAEAQRLTAEVKLWAGRAAEFSRQGNLIFEALPGATGKPFGETAVAEISRLTQDNRRQAQRIGEQVARAEMAEATVERLTNLLEDVVNELDLSDGVIEEHGPLGTDPAVLVRLTLCAKDRTIRNLKAGLADIGDVTALRAKLKEADQRQREYEHEVQTGRSEQHDLLVARAEQAEQERDEAKSLTSYEVAVEWRDKFHAAEQDNARLRAVLEALRQQALDTPTTGVCSNYLVDKITAALAQPPAPDAGASRE